MLTLVDCINSKCGRNLDQVISVIAVRLEENVVERSKTKESFYLPGQL